MFYGESLMINEPDVLYKRVIIIGSSGMLGQSYEKFFNDLSIETIGISRRGPDIFFDLENNLEKIANIIKPLRPDLVINCAAIVSLSECEKNPLKATVINSLVVKELTSVCRKLDCKFIQVSTDHFYSEDGYKLHKETDNVKILNNYAKTKYEGELFAQKYSNSLILRTNISGFRQNSNSATFIEWLLESILSKKHIILFSDFITSTIDVDTFAKISVFLSCNNKGLFNIGSSNPVSKKDFALNLAKKLNINLTSYEEKSVKFLLPKRAESLGLDCSKIEKLLNLQMPTHQDVINNFVREIKIRRELC